MGAITSPWATKGTLGSSALNSLASATFALVGTLDLSSTGPLDVAVEVEATPGAVSGNKQLVVYAKVSFDGVDYSTGPETGTSSADEINLYPLGTLPLNSSDTFQRGSFSVLNALGFVPPFLKVVVKNETGSALAASGHKVSYSVRTGYAA